MILTNQLLLNTNSTSNGRSYTSEGLRLIADQINFKRDICFGTTGYHGVSVDLRKVSHRLYGATAQNNRLYANIEVLEDLEEGAKLVGKIYDTVFRTCCMGTVDPSTNAVNTDTLVFLYTAAIPKSEDTLNLN